MPKNLFDSPDPIFNTDSEEPSEESTEEWPQGIAVNKSESLVLHESPDLPDNLPSVDTTGLTDITGGRASWSCVTGGVTLRARLTLTGSFDWARNIDGGAFDVEDQRTGRYTDNFWRISVNNSRAREGDYVVVTGTPPANVSGSFRFRLYADEILFYTRNPRTYEDGPSSDVISSYVAVSNLPATAAWSSVSFTAGKLQGTITFTGQDVTEVSSSAFEVLNNSNTVQTGWSITVSSRTATSGTGIIIKATPPSNLSTSYKLRLKATSIRIGGGALQNTPASAVTSSAVLINTVPISVAWSNLGYNFSIHKLEATITFTGASIAGIAATDFEILNATNAVQTGWSFDTPSSTASSGAGITIRVIPPFATNNYFKLRLKANSVRSGGVSYDNVPTSAATSNLVAVSNSAGFNALWSNMRGGTAISGTIVFSTNITGLSTSDFKVVNSSNTELTGWTIDLSHTGNISANTRVIVLASKYSPTSGKLVLKASSVQSGSTNYPSSDVRGLYVTVARQFSGNFQFGRASFLNGRMAVYFWPGRSINSSHFKILNASGIIQTGWSITVNPSVSSWASVYATPPANTLGLFRFRFGASLTSGDALVNNTLTISWGSVSYCATSGKLVGTLNFSNNAGGFSSTDLRVINSSGTVQTTWRF